MMVGVALQLIIPLSPHLARVEEERVHSPNKYRSKREGGVYVCTVQYIRTDCRLLVPLISPS
jgi:hypothetical protein